MVLEAEIFWKSSFTPGSKNKAGLQISKYSCFMWVLPICGSREFQWVVFYVGFNSFTPEIFVSHVGFNSFAPEILVFHVGFNAFWVSRASESRVSCGF